MSKSLILSFIKSSLFRILLMLRWTIEQQLLRASLDRTLKGPGFISTSPDNKNFGNVGMFMWKIAICRRYGGYRILQSNRYYATYYSVLGIKPDASTADIKSAYIEKCQQWHPDKNKGQAESNSKFVEIQEAYSVLSKPDKREMYDMTISVQPKPRFHKAYPPQRERVFQNRKKHSADTIYWEPTNLREFKRTVVYRVIRNISAFLFILWVSTKTVYKIKLRQMEERCRLRDEGKL